MAAEEKRVHPLFGEPVKVAVDDLIKHAAAHEAREKVRAVFKPALDFVCGLEEVDGLNVELMALMKRAVAIYIPQAQEQAIRAAVAKLMKSEG